MQFIKEAVKIIRNGGVVICPTDTVYGLVCDATNKKAVDKIFKIKKRPKSKPLPVFVKDLKMAKELAEIDEKQEEFLRKVWPCPHRYASKLACEALRAGREKVTVVLKRKKSNLKLYGVAKTTIALRVPKHKVISHMLSVIGRPLVGTSANISGQTASTKIKEVLKRFALSRVEGQPDFIIDAGNLPKSKPSKIIDLTQKPYKILRA